jgi:hypothetical protein
MTAQTDATPNSRRSPMEHERDMPDAQTAAQDHAEIWLEPKAAEYTEEGRMWCQDQVWDENDGTPQRYVRADLHDAAQAEIAKLRAAADGMAEALKTAVDYASDQSLGYVWYETRKGKSKALVQGDADQAHADMQMFKDALAAHRIATDAQP